jgi:deoxycytidylate deaminase
MDNLVTERTRCISSTKDEAGLSRSQHNWLQVAIALANANTYRWQHGAVIVKHGHVEVGMSRKRNNPKNMSTEHLGECSIHAEMDAVARMRDPRGATMFVARVNKRGELRNSRPCGNCEIAMEKIGIRRVIHT